MFIFRSNYKKYGRKDDFCFIEFQGRVHYVEEIADELISKFQVKKNLMQIRVGRYIIQGSLRKALISFKLKLDSRKPNAVEQAFYSAR